MWGEFDKGGPCFRRDMEMGGWGWTVGTGQSSASLQSPMSTCGPLLSLSVEGGRREEGGGGRARGTGRRRRQQAAGAGVGLGVASPSHIPSEGRGRQIEIFFLAPQGDFGGILHVE